MPLVCSKAPRKKHKLAIGSLNQGVARARRNPAAPAVLSAEEGVREKGELTTARFVAGEGVEAAPAGAPGGAERRWPLRVGYRRGDPRGSPTSECSGSSVLWGRF
jgi:hypothetical protein